MSSASSSAASALQSLGLVPKPVSLKFQAGGAFRLTSGTIIHAGTGAMPEANYLAAALAPATGYNLTVDTLPTFAPNATDGIILWLDPSLKLGAEGYRLESDHSAVRISAARPAGLFYGCQTLRQLLPVEILSGNPIAGIDWSIPAVTIEDHPRFGWRGHLFDTCRHFFTIDEVKRAIDLLALHKCNRFHWHLTEDQGWRIEIKRYPKLTETGARRTENDGSRYGGFYTQAEIRDVVAYAAARHITVVPEIEMPGHSRAALTAYPELGCTGGPYQVSNDWGIYKDVYCAGRESTFTFLQNVMDEVLDLFPSQYIHIGGDECPKDAWKACPHCQDRMRAEGLKDEHELQSYFIHRFDQYLASRGRRLIGWDEILEGGLAPGAVVQSWRGIKGGIEAASARHDVIMSPYSHCYLDYSYGATPLQQTYSYEPVPTELSRALAKHVLGVEGNMWTEWVADRDRYDYQTYPRMSALAEVAWSPAKGRSWKEFEARMATHLKRLEIAGVKYGREEKLDIDDATKLGVWTQDMMREHDVDLEYSVDGRFAAPGEYRIALWYTSGNAGIQGYSVTLLSGGREVAKDIHACWSGIDKRDVVYTLRLEEPVTSGTIRIRAKAMGGLDSNGDVLLLKRVETVIP